MAIINVITFIIGFFGIIIISWGVLLVTVEFCYSQCVSFFHKKNQFNNIYLRRQLGSYILLGLEFMIAADIMHTFIKPSKDELIVLGSIVAIRTVISYFLDKELKGGSEK